jgi:hypothetical protein
MEKEERTGKGTTLRKKRNHKRERKGKIRGGRGREKQELPPSHGRGNKRPPAGQPSAGHRRRRMSGARQKAAAFRRAARPTGNFQKSCFFLQLFHGQPSSSISAGNRRTVPRCLCGFSNFVFFQKSATNSKFSKKAEKYALTKNQVCCLRILGALLR